jgi:hypothetical protein
MPAEQAQLAEGGDARFREAWTELRGDEAVQFDLTPAPPPPEPPEWLRTLGERISDFFKPVGRALDWISSFMPDAPYARILLWTVLILAFAALAWVLVQRVRSGEWRLPRRWRKGDEEELSDEGWVPEAEPARAWLEEADRLAERGEFAAAAHHLLLRSIEDIQWRRPRLVRPALTSRDLAATEEIPPPARAIFGQIVAIVERSLFGGRDVSADEWQAARTSYADFALSRSWKA